MMVLTMMMMWIDGDGVLCNCDIPHITQVVLCEALKRIKKHESKKINHPNIDLVRKTSMQGFDEVCAHCL